MKEGDIVKFHFSDYYGNGKGRYLGRGLSESYKDIITLELIDTDIKFARKSIGKHIKMPIWAIQK